MALAIIDRKTTATLIVRLEAELSILFVMDCTGYGSKGDIPSLSTSCTDTTKECSTLRFSVLWGRVATVEVCQ